MKKTNPFTTNVRSILSGIVLGSTLSVQAESVETHAPEQVHSEQVHALYLNKSASPEARAKDLIDRLTVEEKITSQGGVNSMSFRAIPRLNLPAPMMADASQGIRLTNTLTNKITGGVVDQANGISGKDLKSVSFPGMLPMAGTWNPELAKALGEAMGEQCRVLGVDILLGPGINMYRTSAGGRAFEYMGEDPYFTSRMVVPYIRGVQSKGIIATAKHFICNDVEFCRHMASSEVDMRTIREIYLPPWQAAIQEAQTGAIMTGNNQVNNIPICMHKPLLQDILRDEFGFKGICMSDWQNTNYYQDRLDLVLPSGHSLYMPDNNGFRKWFLTTWEAASAERRQEMEQQLDQMTLHNLIPLFASGYYDRGETKPGYSPVFEKHKVIARDIAEEAICMLKNEEKTLPLKESEKILFIGEEELWTGGGSGFVRGYDHTSYKKALKKTFGENIVFTSADKVTKEQYQAADVVLYSLIKHGGEGRDIPFELPTQQQEEIERVLNSHDRVIIIATACAGFDMPWLAKVKSMLWCYFLGQERGNALANILTGKRSPSGKLPFTIEKKFADSVDPAFNFIGGKPFWLGANQYKNYWLTGRIPEKGNESLLTQFIPNIKPGEAPQIAYKEGLFMGYRWFDHKKIEPQFPFGFGLSYTTFSYQDLQVKESDLADYPVTATITLKNTGTAIGKEVVQIYVSDIVSRVEQPVKELAGFAKVELNPGESKALEIPLHRTAFEFFDTESNKWELEPGEFTIHAGGSSNALPCKTTIQK